MQIVLINLWISHLLQRFNMRGGIRILAEFHSTVHLRFIEVIGNRRKHLERRFKARPAGEQALSVGMLRMIKN